MTPEYIQSDASSHLAAASADLETLEALMQRINAIGQPAASRPLGWGVRSRQAYFLGAPQRGDISIPLYSWDGERAVEAPASGFTAALTDISIEVRTSESFGDREKLRLDFDLGNDVDPIALRVGLDTNAAKTIVAILQMGDPSRPLSWSFRFGDHESGKVVLANAYSGDKWIDPRPAFAGTYADLTAAERVESIRAALSATLGMLPSQARELSQAAQAA